MSVQYSTVQNQADVFGFCLITSLRTRPVGLMSHVFDVGIDSIQAGTFNIIVGVGKRGAY